MYQQMMAAGAMPGQRHPSSAHPHSLSTPYPPTGMPFIFKHPTGTFTASRGYDILG